MALTFGPCPNLGDPVELNDEREQHISEGHGELLLSRSVYISFALASPDRIQRKIPEDNSLQFCRWYNDLGTYVVVAVVSDPGPGKWIVTAYVTHRLPRVRNNMGTRVIFEYDRIGNLLYVGKCRPYVGQDIRRARATWSSPDSTLTLTKCKALR